MKIDTAITRTAHRTRDDEPTSWQAEREAVPQCPPLAFDDDDGEATAAWLAQIDAGRIRVS